MNLYRIKEPKHGNFNRLDSRLAEERRWLDNLKMDGVLVPVEPCEHGKIDAHEEWGYRSDCGHGKGHDDGDGEYFCDSIDQCPGAGLEVDDE